MLESLTIHQIALIDDVTIHFHQGMHALTGETGAGKSIVVDAVTLVLGGRADRDLIRTGCDKASVEAEFSVSNNEKVHSFMEQESIEYDGSHIVIYREISISGRNICRVCGVMIPVATTIIALRARTQGIDIKSFPFSIISLPCGGPNGNINT